MHRKHVCLTKVLEGGYEVSVSFKPLVPPAELRGEGSRNMDLIDRRNKTHPWIALDKCLCILGKKTWPIRVLKASYPIWNAEMTKIGNRFDPKLIQLGKRHIAKLPVVFTWTQVCPVVRGSITQELDTKFTDEFKVLLPALIVIAFLHLVHTLRSSVRQAYRGIAVLNPCGKHELCQRISFNTELQFGSGPARLRSFPAFY